MRLARLTKPQVQLTNEILREIRGDMSQVEMAALYGTTVATIYTWENGRRQPSVSSLAKFAAMADAGLYCELLDSLRLLPTNRVVLSLDEFLRLAGHDPDEVAAMARETAEHAYEDAAAAEEKADDESALVTAKLVQGQWVRICSGCAKEMRDECSDEYPMEAPVWCLDCYGNQLGG